MKHLIIAAFFLFAASGLHAQSRTGFKTTQEAVRYYEELVGSLIQQVKLMQDDNAKLQADVADLKKRVDVLTSKAQASERELETLKKQIAADTETRRLQMKMLADKLAAAPVRTRETPEAEQGEFIEHTVEAGTTLSALAKAYGVTVSDIRKANKLQGNNIRVGQKLLIPVKKH